MPVVVLFLLVPVLALFVALAFYARRPWLCRVAWFVLVFVTLWWTYSLRGVGLALPILAGVFLLRLIRSAQPDLTWRQACRRAWGCLKC